MDDALKEFEELIAKLAAKLAVARGEAITQYGGGCEVRDLAFAVGADQYLVAEALEKMEEKGAVEQVGAWLPYGMTQYRSAAEVAAV
jgi:DNA-binding MarR family transcriptional regulator